ncbi:MAG: ATP-binding cassette domain-containing protein, partial [Verrucomicrobia bacterium]|nr:ATP-binding cassette domain-containing protein [Verrucomicrobiota bacterium]
RYTYRGQKRSALEGITLDVSPGEFVAIIGPSLAGKSTLAACVNGLVPHFFKGSFQGDVRVLGRNTRECSVAQLSEDVGLVFQDFEAQLFSTSVELEAAFGPENLGVAHDEIGRRIADSLGLVGLEGLRRRAPTTLSGGQKQKLAIASVLAMKPRLLVMDEPTTDLDPASKSGVLEIADKLRARPDAALMVVEHETEELLRADRILLLQEGKPIRCGPTADVLREVELLKKLGVMPLGVTSYFSALGATPAPLTPEDGVREFQARGWGIAEDKYASLLAADQARARSSADVVIRCTGLEHAYAGGFKALQGVDLEIRRGEMVAVVGQNGSGKTTLVKHFNGLLMPTAGNVDVDGAPTVKQGIFNLGRKVGYVFQNPDHQIFCQTVFDEVAYTLRLRKLGEAEIRARVQEALAAVNLSGLEQEDPFTLTKGGRQRVAVASVLAAKPDVIILDEPTTGLDYAEQRGMMDLARQLNRAGSTIIFVTHHMWVVAEYSDRVVVVKDGRILMQGPTREVLACENELASANLRPPQIVRLSNRLGRMALTVDELVACTVVGQRHDGVVSRE